MSNTIAPKASRRIIDRNAPLLNAGHLDVRSGIVELLNAAGQTAACNLERMRQVYLTWAILQTVSTKSSKQLTTIVA